MCGESPARQLTRRAETPDAEARPAPRGLRAQGRAGARPAGPGHEGRERRAGRRRARRPRGRALASAPPRASPRPPCGAGGAASRAAKASFTADERPWKQRRMLSMTAAVSRDAIQAAPTARPWPPACCAATGPCRSPAWTPSWGKKSRAPPSRHLAEDTYAPAAGPPTWRRRPARRGDVAGGAGPRRGAKVPGRRQQEKHEGARPARRVTSPEGGASTRSFVAARGARGGGRKVTWRRLRLWITRVAEDDVMRV